MKTRYFAFICVLLYGCDGVVIQCDFFAGGVCVVTNGLEVYPDDVEQAIDILQEEIDKKIDAGNIKKIFEDDGVVATFIDEDLLLNCEVVNRKIFICKNISGAIYDNWDIYIEWRSCIGRTSFQHELLHNIEQNVLGIKDSEH